MRVTILCAFLFLQSSVIPTGLGLQSQQPKERIALRGHKDIVMAVAFSPDGKTLASASQDRTIKLWDVATGKSTATLKGHSPDFNGIFSVRFSPDGKTL